MLSLARTALYSIVIFWSFLAFVLSAAFIGRTNNDFSTYNEGSAAVLAAALLILLTLPVVHFFFHRRGSASIVASVLVELVLLSVLWVIMLGGAAAMSDQLGGLYYCSGSICSLARATQAFAWLTWITLTILLALVATLAILSTRKAEQSVWTRPLDHEHVQVGAGGGSGLGGRWHGKHHEKGAQPPTTSSQPTSNGAPVMSSAQV
ncbi:hypothetical protein JCM3765_007115 [Sporobolomyces pararoseus]